MLSGFGMFFSKVNRFPAVDNGKIALIPFLEASKGIVEFVELLGSVFSPVKQDINGNIEKLYQIHHSNEEKFITINNIIESELEEDYANRIGIDALLWLKRALEYVLVFISCLVEDSKLDSPTENLTPFFHKAYEETLKPFHGWLVQKIFGLIVYAAPSRKSLLQLLSDDKGTYSEEKIFEDAEIYITELRSNINTINELYTTHNLHSNQKV